ncbi:hypothetical protein [Lutibacter sp.]
MNFNSWLNQTKIDEPDLELFITKLEPFFSNVGFKGAEFERKVTLGLSKMDSEVEELLKPEPNVED